MPSWPRIATSLRYYSSQARKGLSELISNPGLKYHVYWSRTNDPHLNLATEYFLLEHSHQSSTVLFLYANSPCVVIGRNQNPWLEVDLRLLKHKPGSISDRDQEGNESGLEVELLRRRSGGGAVFHDQGNLNYSVICPSKDFNRDKHAEMVVRAMRPFNARARVNERHDIVLDQGDFQGSESTWESVDPYKTSYFSDSKTPLKVSGSAFKLTAKRSLHHGTCLLASENLGQISNFLHSPARPHMKAKGVESVRSPVGNVFSGPSQSLQESLQAGIVREFESMYKIDRDLVALFSKHSQVMNIQIVGNCCYGHLNHGAIAEIAAEVRKIKVSDQRNCITFVRVLTCYQPAVS